MITTIMMGFATVAMTIATVFGLYVTIYLGLALIHALFKVDVDEWSIPKGVILGGAVGLVLWGIVFGTLYGIGFVMMRFTGG